MADDVPQDVTQPAAAAGGPVSHAIFRVARLHKMIAGQLLRETGLYPNQELVMMRLWDAGPQRQVDLIRLIDSDAATMTRTVQRLERAGFVRRSRSRTDRRAVIIEATPASQALRVQVEQIWAELEALTVGSLADDQRRDALDALQTLERNLLAAASRR